MPRKKDLTGQKFGKLTVVEEADRNLMKTGMYDTLWWCECECGNRVLRARGSLNSKKEQSCGCSYVNPRKTHGLSESRLYRIYRHMLNRCFNPNVERFPNYGGRGITVCNEWRHFEPFLEWATNNGYNDTLTLERKDVDGNYEPENCCWIPKSDQPKNKQNTIYVEVDGAKRRLKDCADELGLDYEMMRHRWQKGDRGEDLFRPFGKRLDRKNADLSKLSSP